MKKWFILTLCAMGLFCMPIAHAAEFVSGEQISINEGQTFSEDVYAAGGSGDIRGDIAEDLIVTGGKMFVRSAVGHDLLLAGGMLDVAGVIGDDARIAGGVINIDSVVQDDLVVAGGVVHVRRDAKIMGDAIITGGSLIIDGEIMGKTNIAGGEVDINGTLSGPVMVESELLRIHDQASFGDVLTYNGISEPVVHDSAQFAQPMVVELSAPGSKQALKKSKKYGDEPQRLGTVIGNVIGVWAIYKFIVFLIAGLLMIYIFKAGSKTMVEQAHTEFANSFLKGLVTMIVVPVAVIITFALIVLPKLGMAAMMIMGLFCILSTSLMGPLVGYALIKKFSKTKKKTLVLDWKMALLGNITLFVLAFIPILGWLVIFIVMVAMFGAVVDTAIKRFWIKR